MVVILDTDHLTVIQRRAEPAYSRLRARLLELPTNTVQTTIVSFEEQMRGWLSVIARVRNQSGEVVAYSAPSGVVAILQRDSCAGLHRDRRYAIWRLKTLKTRCRLHGSEDRFDCPIARWPSVVE